MKTAPLSLLFGCLFGGSAIASVTLQISAPFVGNIASGFADENGIVKNGMLYSVLVDTNGNGFSLGQYTAFDVSTSGFLTTLLGPTDDFYFFNGGRTTNDSSSETEVGGVVTGGNGTIRTIANLILSSGTTQVSTGDPYGLIYFSTSIATAGARYGFFTTGTFILPPDTTNPDVSAPFAGADPIRPATYTVVPEPSSLLLCASGVVLLGFRRRARL